MTPLRECSAAACPNCAGDRLLTWKTRPICRACAEYLDQDNDLPYVKLSPSFPRDQLSVTADCPGHFSYKGKPVVFG